MKYLIFVISMMAMIGCSREITENEEAKEVQTEVTPEVNDSTKEEEKQDPDIGDWKPGDKGEADLEEV